LNYLVSFSTANLTYHIVDLATYYLFERTSGHQEKASAQ